MMGGLMILAPSQSLLRDWIVKVAADVAAMAKGRTTRIAEAYLWHAARGEVSDVTARFISALAHGTADKARRGARALAAIGESSGVDTALGVILALECLMSSGGCRDGV